MSSESDLSILRESDVIHLTGLSRSSIRRLEQAGNFPGRIRLSSKTVGWLKKDVLKWIENRPSVSG